MSLQPWITVKDVEALVSALEEAEYQDDKARRTLLVQFTRDRLREDEPGAGFTPDRLDNGHHDLLSIVRLAAHRRGGIRALADAAETLAVDGSTAQHFVDRCRTIAEREPTILNRDDDRRSLRRALGAVFLTQPLPSLFARAAPTRATTTHSVLWAAVLDLASMGSPLPLLQFLELVAADAENEDAGDALRKWSDDHHAALTTEDVWARVLNLRKELAAHKPELTTAPGLMVRLDGEGDAWSVTAWIWAGLDTPGPNIGPGDVTWAELELWLSDVLAQHAVGLLNADADLPPLIEFVLPARQLSDTVEALTVTLDGRADRLGVRHQVSVRPDDRSAAGSDLLQRRWPVAAEVLDSPEVPATSSAWWMHSTVDETVQAPSGEQTQWAWLAITCPRMAAAEPAATVAMLDTGAPIAVWLRGKRDAADSQQAITKTTANRYLGELPVAVQGRRKVGWNKPAADADRHLVLMWDDPTRPPPPRTPLAAPLS